MDNAQTIIAMNHALLAGHLERWADRVELPGPGHDQIFGFTDALRDIAAHLRQGDYTPEGAEFHSLLGKPK